MQGSQADAEIPKDNVRMKVILHDNFQLMKILEQFHCRPQSIYKLLTVPAEPVTPKSFQIVVNIYTKCRAHVTHQVELFPYECFFKYVALSYLAFEE